MGIVFTDIELDFMKTLKDQSDRISELKEAMRKAADIIDAELYHQREKVKDASSLLRNALTK